MARLNTTRLPPSTCPGCGYKMDAASPMEGRARPRPGDWTVCLRCSEPLVFDEGMQPKPPALGAYDALRLEAPEIHRKLEVARGLLKGLIAKGDWMNGRPAPKG